MKSISDDDLCATCVNCAYAPGEMSRCNKNWPGREDEDGYIRECPLFGPISADCENWLPETQSTFV